MLIRKRDGLVTGTRGRRGGVMDGSELKKPLPSHTQRPRNSRRQSQRGRGRMT